MMHMSVWIVIRITSMISWMLKMVIKMNGINITIVILVIWMIVTIFIRIVIIIFGWSSERPGWLSGESRPSDHHYGHTAGHNHHWVSQTFIRMVNNHQDGQRMIRMVWLGCSSRWLKKINCFIPPPSHQLDQSQHNCSLIVNLKIEIQSLRNR